MADIPDPVKIHCKAKMCDGDPVTFDWIDMGQVYEPEIQQNVYRTVMSGEGFYVVSDVPMVSDSMAWRADRARLALERCGVDTTTAESEEKFYQPLPGCTMQTGSWVNRRWVKMFPTESMRDFLGLFGNGPISPPPDPRESEVYRLTRMLIARGLTISDLERRLEEKPGPSADMMAAGAAALQDRLVKFAILDEGRIGLSGGLGLTALAIWRAMEKAR